MLQTGLLLSGMLLASLPGCGPTLTGDVVGPEYPITTRQSAVLNVQVFRDDTHITFTNTTAEPLPEGLLWINHAYSKPFPGLGIAQTATLNLYDFKDQYGEEFRGGGFFATQPPDRVVIIQLQAGEKLLGLVTIAKDE